MIYFTLIFAVLELLVPSHTGWVHNFMLAGLFWSTIIYYYFNEKTRDIHKDIGVILYTLLFIGITVVVSLYAFGIYIRDKYMPRFNKDTSFYVCFTNTCCHIVKLLKQ